MIVERKPVQCRELTEEEISCVSGGGSTESYMNGTTEVTDYFDDAGNYTGSTYSFSDGSMDVYDRSSGTITSYDSGTCGYWEVGGSFGIGMGLYGTCDGMGIEWNGGVGVYGQIGTADNSTDAAQQVGHTEVVVGTDSSMSPSATIDGSGNVNVSGSVGIYSKDADGLTNYQ